MTDRYYPRYRQYANGSLLSDGGGISGSSTSLRVVATNQRNGTRYHCAVTGLLKGDSKVKTKNTPAMTGCHQQHRADHHQPLLLVSP